MSRIPYKHIVSTVANKAPSSANLAVAEIGINTTDKKIYSKDPSGNIVVFDVAETANIANTANVANIASVANSVAVANVSGIGNIATVDLSGNIGQMLRGDGSWGEAGAVANATYANVAGTVSTNAQPNITSVGTLTTLSVSGTSTMTGNVTMLNDLQVNGNINFSGNVTQIWLHTCG
jgi:hypothetical protein